MTEVVTIIVPVFKHWELMPIFFRKMACQSFSSDLWKLIVVDNGSPDIPRQEDLPNFVTLLTCAIPGSYAARNFGLKHAKGELILFVDADCQPDSSWLEAHWHAYKQNGVATLNAGAVTVTKLTPGAANDYELYDSFLGIPQKRYATKRGYAVTANLAVPRNVFDVVGAFDEKRFSGGDAEFCQRAQKAGMQLCYIPEAEVLHPARSTWKELEIKARRVKGGQLRNGPLKRRVGFFFKSFLYPVAMVSRILKSSLPAEEKKVVLSVAVRLARVELREVFLLILGKQPERR